MHLCVFVCSFRELTSSSNATAEAYRSVAVEIVDDTAVEAVGIIFNAIGRDVKAI